MNNPFLTFVTLVQNDQRIDAVAQSINTTTAENMRLEKTIDDRLSEHTQLEQVLQKLRADIKEKEFEDKRLQERDRVLRVQLESTGSTKELIALEHAVAETVAHRKRIEEEVFVLWEKRDTLELECIADKKRCDEFVAHTRDLMQKNTQRIQELHTEQEGLLAQRSTLLSGSPVEYVEKYVAMRTSIPNPVVSVINGSCGGCSVQLRSSELLLLKRHVLVTCQECFRLLYLV